MLRAMMTSTIHRAVRTGDDPVGACAVQPDSRVATTSSLLS